MDRSESFAIAGIYRVQSKRAGRASRLSGCWATLPKTDPDIGFVNDIVQADPQWRGRAYINIRPAFVELREGEFAEEPDILYKRTHFVPNAASQPMPCDIIDVDKAAARWIGRRQYVRRLFGDNAAAQVEHMIGSVERIAAIEYFLHEAGHCLGYDTETKHRDRYFRIEAKTIWPLVYVEELRADLLAFDLAAKHLNPDLAAALFLYNVMLRLSSHAEGFEYGAPNPYGAIPHMLFAHLSRSGFLRPNRNDNSSGSLAISSLLSEVVVSHMVKLGELARAELIEDESFDATDAALMAAKFYRAAMGDAELTEFDRAMQVRQTSLDLRDPH